MFRFCRNMDLDKSFYLSYRLTQLFIFTAMIMIIIFGFTRNNKASNICGVIEYNCSTVQLTNYINNTEILNFNKLNYKYITQILDSNITLFSNLNLDGNCWLLNENLYDRYICVDLGSSLIFIFGNVILFIVVFFILILMILLYIKMWRNRNKDVSIHS